MASGNKLSSYTIPLDVELTRGTIQSFKQLKNQMDLITGPHGFSYNLQQGVTSEIMKSTQYATLLKTQLIQATNPLTGNLNLTKFNDQLRMSGTSLLDYQKQLSSLGSIGNQAFNSLASSIASAETPLLRTSQAAQQMWNALGNAARWTATSTAIHGIMSTASSAMNYVRNLDNSLNDIRIVTGQTQDQMAKFAVQANQAAKALNTTTNQYAQAALIYYQQGLSNKQVEERTEATIKLANVSGQSAKKVSDQMTAVWNNFYDGGKSLEYYADVITALGATTASSSEEIARGLSKFSSIAQTTGLSYEYATSALSTIVAATRQSADSVGTSLKTLFSRFQGLSLGETLDDGTALNKYSKALNTVGVSVLTANGQLRDMDNILADLGDRWQNLSKAQQAALAQTIGGTRGYTTLMSLMDNWDSFEKNLQTAQNAQGTLDAQAAIYAESWEAASKHVRAASETIYKNLLSDNFFKGATNLFGTLLDGVGSFTTGLGGVSGSLLQLGGIASRVFKDQIASGIDNAALNLRGIFLGDQDVINIKQQASEALRAPVNFSRYDEVNKLQESYNQSLDKRQIEYDMLSRQGKIPSYLQPVYQSMFNAVDNNAQATIQAAESYFQTAEATDFARLESAQRLFYAASQNGTNLNAANNYKGLLDSYSGVYEKQLIANGLQSAAHQTRDQLGNTLKPEEAARVATSVTKTVIGYQKLGQTLDAELQPLKAMSDEIQAQTRLLDERKIKQEDYDKEITNIVNKYWTGGPTGQGGIANLLGQYTGNNFTTLNAIRDDLINNELAANNWDRNNREQLKQAEQNVDKDIELVKNLATGKTNLASMTGAQAESAAKVIQAVTDKRLTQNVLTFGQGMTTIAGAAASVGSSILSTVNTIKIFGDETATANQKASALVSTLGTAPMAISNLSKLWEHRHDAIGGLGGLTVGGAGLATLGIAAAVTTASILARSQEQASQETALKNFTSAAATSAQMAAEAQQKYDQFSVLTETHQQLLQAYQNTGEGSLEQTKALISANNAANNIIETYGLKYGIDYNYGTGSEVLFNQQSLQKAQKQAEQEALNLTYGQTYIRDAKTILEAENNKFNEHLYQQTQDTLKATVASYDGFTLPWEKSTFSLSDMIKAYGSSDATTINEYLDGYQYGKLKVDRESIQTALGVDTWEEAATKVEELTTAFRRNGYEFNNSILNEAISEQKGENYYRQLAAAQEMLGTAAQQAKALGLNADLAVAYLSQDKDALIQRQLSLAQLSSNMSETTFFEQLGSWFTENGTSLKDYYRQITGKTDLTGISEDVMKTTIMENILKEANLNGSEGLQTILGKDLYNQYKDQLDNIVGINQVLQQIDQLGLNSLNSFKNLTKEQLNVELSKLNKEIEDRQKELNNESLSQDRIDQLQTEITTLTNYSKGITQETDKVIQNVVESFGQNLSQEILGQDQAAWGAYQALKDNYSFNELQSIAGYVTQGNVFYGQNTADAIYKAFLNNPANVAFEAMNKIDWSTSISSLADLSKYASRAGDAMNIFDEILTNAVKDVGGEGGIFQQLYNSSGFSKVLEKLEGVYNANGRITSLDITKYAEKSDELFNYLQIGQNSNLQLTSGGLAATLNAINSGDIRAEEVTTDLVNAFSIANQRATIEAEAFDLVSNQDLGESGSQLIKYFQNFGKAYYTAKTNNLTMDDPLMAVMDFMPSHYKDVYFEGLKNGQLKSFKDIMSDPELKEFTSLMDILAGTGKYKGKGGGYMSDVIGWFGDEFRKYTLNPKDNEGNYLRDENGELITQFTSAWLKENGIYFDSDNIDIVGENTKLTTTQLKDVMKTAFGSMMGEEMADNLATIFTEYVSNTSAGAYLAINDTNEAVQSLWDAAKYGQQFSDGTFGGAHFYSEAELQAFYNQRGPYLDPEKYGTDFKSFVNGVLSGVDGRNAQLLATNKEAFKTTELGQDTLNAIFESNKALQEAYGLNNQQTFTDITSLLYSYGAITTKGNSNYLDVNRFTDFIVASGGSAETASQILSGLGSSYWSNENNRYVSSLGATFTDKMGKEYSVTQREGETYDEFSARYQEYYNALNSNKVWIVDENAKFGGYYEENDNGHTVAYMLAHPEQWRYDEKIHGWVEGDYSQGGGGISGFQEGDLGTNNTPANAGTTPSTETPDTSGGNTTSSSSETSKTPSNSSSGTISAEEKWQRGYLEGQARGEVWAKNQASSNPKTYEQLVKEAEAAGGWAYLTENPDKYLTDQQKEEIAAEKYQAQWSSQTNARARAAEIAKTRSVSKPSTVPPPKPKPTPVGTVSKPPKIPDKDQSLLPPNKLTDTITINGHEYRWDYTTGKYDIPSVANSNNEKYYEKQQQATTIDNNIKNSSLAAEFDLANKAIQNEAEEKVTATEDFLGEGTSSFLGATPIVSPREIINNITETIKGLPETIAKAALTSKLGSQYFAETYKLDDETWAQAAARYAEETGDMEGLIPPESTYTPEPDRSRPTTPEQIKAEAEAVKQADEEAERQASIKAQQDALAASRQAEIDAANAIAQQEAEEQATRAQMEADQKAAEEARIDAEQAAAREAQAAQEAAAEAQVTGAADYVKEQAGNQALDWITENGYEQEYINTPGIAAVDFAKQKQAEITDNNTRGSSLAAQATADQKHAEEVAAAEAEAARQIQEANEIRAAEAEIEQSQREAQLAANQTQIDLNNQQIADLEAQRDYFNEEAGMAVSRGDSNGLNYWAGEADKITSQIEDLKAENASREAQQGQLDFESDQYNFQYGMTKDQREDFIADARTKFENGEQLSAFERQALTALGELVETSDGQYQLAKDAKEAKDNKTKNGSNVTTNEEGQLVDEETGEPIELPYEQPTSSGSSGSGYTPSGDGSTPGGGDNGSGGNGSGSSTSSSTDVTSGISGWFDQHSTVMGERDDGRIEYGTVTTDSGMTYNYERDTLTGEVTYSDKPNNFQDQADLAGSQLKFTGQNNARILQFAQGHMAVTGELGPELTIREDGSVDMLGQHGREYTWVNPNDIIYTAAQTTSILGNNNIEWLDSFAKGFNNKIRGYAFGNGAVDTTTTVSPSEVIANTDNPGGVNGFSGIGEAVRKGAYSGTYGGAMAAAEEEAKDPRYDPNTLKERDIVTRYFTILQQIDDITRQVEHFGKVAERAWGEERIQAISRQTDAYKEQYAAYQKYMAEIETYLRSDQDALTLMVEEFARDFKEKTSIDIFGGEASGGSGIKQRTYATTIGSSWASGYNNNVKPHASGYLSKIAAGSGSSSSEGLDPNLRNPINWVSAEYDANGVLTNYREIVTRLMEVYNENAEAFAQDKEAQYKFQEMLKDIQFYTDSLNLYEQQKEVMYDLKNAILDNQVRKIVYEISYKNELDNNALKEINYNFEKIRDNAYRSAEAIDYYATKMDYLDKSNERYKEGIKDILATYSGNVTNGIQNQIMMRLYRKAPMEGYIGGGDGSKSSVEASATVTTDKLIEEAATLGNVDAINKVLQYTEYGLTSVPSRLEEGEKLAVDHIDDNGMIHLNDGSIIDPTKKKRYKEKLPSEDEPEPEELPYFPTSGEIDEYFQNFKAVKIGEETYYMPNTDDVEIREDMVQPVDITRAILNNKGEITDDQKELITAQVKSWYDELAKIAPKLAENIKPIYEDGFMTNFREVITGINEANAQMSDYMYDLLINDTEEFFRVWSEITLKNADFQDITTETATQLENMIDTIYANLQQKEKYIETVFATLGNDIKTFSKELNAQVDEFEYFNEVINDYENIINLTNRRSTNIGSDLIAAISDAQLGNAMNKVSGTRTVRDTMAQMKARVQETYDLTKNAFETYRDELLKTMTAEEAAQNAHYLYLQDKLDQAQDEMDIANAKFEDSNKQFLKAWEDALSKIEQNYTKAVEEASRTFEESFSPYFNTLELLQAQFERQKALEDYYVDDFERIHDLAALDRSIEQSILDTDNLKSKGRLRDLQKEINDLQEDSTELSAYDLDILQKKYDLELARQALEDAKDAKSLVRLARDNNGNWSYVYTSNETEVDEAEQNYENAIRSMEEANQNYIDNLEAQILQVQQSALAAMQGLKITDFANLDEFYAALKNIEDGANETTRYLSEQLGHAFDNNEYLDPFIKDRYNGQNLHNLTTDWNDMTLAAVSGINTLDDATGSIDNRLGALRDKLVEEFIKYSEEQAKVYELAGADIADANGYFSEGINEVMAMSDENVEKTTELADRVGDAFEKTGTKVRDFTKDVFDLTAEYEKLNSALIEFLELSGEHVPEEKYESSTAIDTYKELDEIKQILGKYGKAIVTDYDEYGNRRIYSLQENTEETAEQFASWFDAIAKADAIDVGKDLDTKDEYNEVKSYLDKHGQVYITIDGELKKLVADNEEDMAWLKEKLTAIEEAAKKKTTSASSDYSEPSGNSQSTGFNGFAFEVPVAGGGTEIHIYPPDISKTDPNFQNDAAAAGWKDQPWMDTGGYTGRWQYADTGMYTGEWDGGSERKNGRLAWLHQKELVLNAHDTENFLDAMNIVRQLDNLASWMANGLGDLFMPRVEGNDETLEQNVHIEASFPNAIDHNEIEQAFGNLVNLASQYANRKAFV